MSEARDETPEGSRSPGVFGWFVWAASLILIIYPLSFGPACKLTIENQAFGARFGRAYETVYYPLILVGTRCHYTYLGALLWWYVTDVWKVPMYWN
jgi:hypothetical protein